MSGAATTVTRVGPAAAPGLAPLRCTLRLSAPTSVGRARLVPAAAPGHVAAEEAAPVVAVAVVGPAAAVAVVGRPAAAVAVAVVGRGRTTGIAGAGLEPAGPRRCLCIANEASHKVAPTAAPEPIAASTAAEVGPPESTTVLGLPAL